MSPRRRRRPALVVLGAAVLAAASAFVAPAPASAQVAQWAAGLQGGSGITMAGGQGASAMRMSPVFLEASIRHWTDEQRALRFGGGLRVEILDTVSAGGVVRAELHRDLGVLSLSPGIGFPFILVPGSMFGAEVSLQARIPVGDFGITALLFADVFLFGSDVPSKTAVVALNGALGVDFSL